MEQEILHSVKQMLLMFSPLTAQLVVSVCKNSSSSSSGQKSAILFFYCMHPFIQTPSLIHTASLEAQHQYRVTTLQTVPGQIVSKYSPSKRLDDLLISY